MKTLTDYQLKHDAYPSIGAFRPSRDGMPQSETLSSSDRQKYPEPSASSPIFRENRLLTPEANAEITKGNIPDMSRVCLDLFDTFLKPDAPYAAFQFIPVLKALNSIGRAAANRFMKNPVTRHVLVDNALLKVVLIHWEPGVYSGIHGHPKGGCVFKVLKGSLEEKRYGTGKAHRLLAVSTFKSGSMAYIDDDMAYHAVGNPFGKPAISLHVYTPGKNL
jgi:hypothetical protein